VDLLGDLPQPQAVVTGPGAGSCSRRSASLLRFASAALFRAASRARNRPVTHRARPRVRSWRRAGCHAGRQLRPASVAAHVFRAGEHRVRCRLLAEQGAGPARSRIGSGERARSLGALLAFGGAGLLVASELTDRLEGLEGTIGMGALNLITIQVRSYARQNEIAPACAVAAPAWIDGVFGSPTMPGFGSWSARLAGTASCRLDRRPPGERTVFRPCTDMGVASVSVRWRRRSGRRR
jgi:hypothetical protein